MDPALFLAASGNAQTKALGIDATATVSLLLVYDDRSFESIPIGSVVISTSGNVVRVIAVTASNEYTVNPVVANGVEATVCFHYSKASNLFYYQCSTFVIIKPSAIPVKSFFPFPASAWTTSNFSMSFLKRIDKTNVWQSVRVSVTLSLSNGTDVDFSSSKDKVLTCTQSPTSPVLHRLVMRNVCASETF